jgi:hypothetical protein
VRTRPAWQSMHCEAPLTFMNEPGGQSCKLTTRLSPQPAERGERNCLKDETNLARSLLVRIRVSAVGQRNHGIRGLEATKSLHQGNSPAPFASGAVGGARLVASQRVGPLLARQALHGARRVGKRARLARAAGLKATPIKLLQNCEKRVRWKVPLVPGRS